MAEHAHASAHGHAPTSRKTYMVVWLLLAVFTVLEILVALPTLGVNRVLVGSALVALAITKASMVGYYYMHLKQEMRALKLTVVLPFLFPAVYAVILVAEAAWRLVR